MTDAKEPEYFYRLISLVVDLGTEGLCKVFKKHIPEGQTIESYLVSRNSTIEREMKCFNDMQYRIITAPHPDQSALDISLLSVLIKVLTNIQEPIGGWENKCPAPTDDSPGAYIMRLKSVRNAVLAHPSTCALTKLEYEKHWTETETALLGLAGYVSETERQTIKQKIDEAKTKQLLTSPPNEYKYALEMLKKWYKEDTEMEKRVEKLKNEVDGIKRQQDDTNSAMDDLRGQQDQTNSAIDDLRGQQDQTNSAIDDLKRQQDKTNSAIHDLMKFNKKEDTSQKTGGINPCRDWENFGALSGYKQTQLDELQNSYRNKASKQSNEEKKTVMIKVMKKSSKLQSYEKKDGSSMQFFNVIGACNSTIHILKVYQIHRFTMVNVGKSYKFSNCLVKSDGLWVVSSSSIGYVAPVAVQDGLTIPNLREEEPSAGSKRTLAQALGSPSRSSITAKIVKVSPLKFRREGSLAVRTLGLKDESGLAKVALFANLAEEIYKENSTIGLTAVYQKTFGKKNQLVVTRQTSCQIQESFREMLRRWHSVVAQRDENPRELLAAAFKGIHSTAKKILNVGELKGPEELKLKPETEKKIQNITFQASQSTGKWL